MSNTVGEVFNIGADQPYTINELARAVMNATGKTVPIKYLDARKEVLHAYADHTKFNKYFDSTPEPLSLDEGLARMAEWVNKIGPRDSMPFSNLELTEGLPASWQSIISE